MIIDQRRAHIRILYERYIDQIGQRNMPSQKLLFPDTVHLSQSDNVLLQNIMPEFANAGFELTALGATSYAINAVPAGLDGLNYVNLVQDLVSSAREKSASAIDEINRSMALTLARSAAVDYDQVLSNDEMESITNDLFACSNANYTPDGCKILAILKQTEIDHLLG